jgi:hypothetical protein
MNPVPKRPVLMLLTSHWISMLGAALATTAGFSWLFTLPTQVQGHASNPYIGILDFIVIPMVLVTGLVLIAAGSSWRESVSQTRWTLLRTGRLIFVNSPSSSR